MVLHSPVVVFSSTLSSATSQQTGKHLLKPDSTSVGDRSIIPAVGAALSCDCLLAVQENVPCHECRINTHELEYVQYFYNVAANSIALEERLCPGQQLGSMLKKIAGASLKSCDTEKGDCATLPALSVVISHQCCCRLN